VVINKMAEEKQINPKNRKTILTLFLLLSPSLLLAWPADQYNNVITGMKLCVFIYQAIMMQNFISDHYKNM